MRNLLLLIVLFSISCSTTVSMRQPTNQTLTATVGSPVASWRWKVWQDYPARAMAGTLIYSGLDSDKILLSYREYKGSASAGPNFANPIDTQELQYDLSKSREINFRGIVIRIEEFTPQYIRYNIITGPSEENVENVI